MYYICKGFRGSSSVGRASASQAEGHGFESRLPLSVLGNSYFLVFFSLFHSNLLGYIPNFA